MPRDSNPLDRVFDLFEASTEAIVGFDARLSGTESRADRVEAFLERLAKDRDHEIETIVEERVARALSRLGAPPVPAAAWWLTEKTVMRVAAAVLAVTNAIQGLT